MRESKRVVSLYPMKKMAWNKCGIESPVPQRLPTVHKVEYKYSWGFTLFLPGNQMGNLVSCPRIQAPNTNHNCFVLTHSNLNLLGKKHQKPTTAIILPNVRILMKQKSDRQRQVGWLDSFDWERDRERRERWEAEEEKRGRSWRAALCCDSWLLQITTKPLEHLRSGCCMARVPLQHDPYILPGFRRRGSVRVPHPDDYPKWQNQEVSLAD